MLLELFACLMMAGSGAGLLGTLVAWSTLAARRHARFVRDMREDGTFRIVDVATSDTMVPVVLRVGHGDRVAMLAVAHHNLHETWSMSLEGEVPGTTRIIRVLHPVWARATVGLHAAPHGAVEMGARSLPFVVAADELDDAIAYLQSSGLMDALGELADTGVLRSVEIAPQKLHLELDRDRLDVAEATWCVEALFAVHDVARGQRSSIRAMPRKGPPVAIHAISGIPMAVTSRTR